MRVVVRSQSSHGSGSLSALDGRAICMEMPLTEDCSLWRQLAYLLKASLDMLPPDLCPSLQTSYCVMVFSVR